MIWFKDHNEIHLYDDKMNIKLSRLIISAHVMKTFIYYKSIKRNSI